MTATRILTQTEIAQLLTPRDGMDALRAALITRAEGKALQPLRSIHWLPDRSGAFGLMPAWIADPPALGGKFISVFSANHGTELDSHQGVVLVFETEQGRLTGILDATEITARRTAAVSGVATEALAREDSTELAFIGTGVQGWSHLGPMMEARPFRRIQIAGRRMAEAEALAAHARQTYGIEATALTDARTAVSNADVICTVTSATDPVLLGDWIKPGAHINAVGACLPATRELDGPAVAKSSLFVDAEESARNESGDFLLARDEGAIKDDHITAELGEVLSDRHPGRSGEQEVTLFKSLGIGVEDVAVAVMLLEKAAEKDVGTVLNIGGARPTGK